MLISNAKTTWLENSSRREKSDATSGRTGVGSKMNFI
jgi:hypothetical protein